MTELQAAYLTHTTGHVPARIVPPEPAPLDARTRALVIGFRAALLLLADVLGAYAGLPKRNSIDSQT